MPMIQTNRGCPFSCTFCQEGQEYFNKVRRHSLKFVQEELNYISKKVRPDAGLWITDSNWAMYKWDEDIADHISSLQKNIGWPRELITSTGKAQLERIVRIAKKLNNSIVKGFKSTLIPVQPLLYILYVLCVLYSLT